MPRQYLDSAATNSCLPSVCVSGGFWGIYGLRNAVDIVVNLTHTEHEKVSMVQYEKFESQRYDNKSEGLCVKSRINGF